MQNSVLLRMFETDTSGKGVKDTHFFQHVLKSFGYSSSLTRCNTNKLSFLLKEKMGEMIISLFGELFSLRDWKVSRSWKGVLISGEPRELLQFW